MKKFIVYSLLSIISLLSAIYYLPSAIHAADSSPSADLRQKLKALQEEIASRASQLKPDVSKKLQNKAFTGTIKSLPPSSILISTSRGDKTITLSEFTEYIWKGRASTLKSLTAGNFLAVLGDLDEKENLLAKRVIRLESLPEKEFIFGKVSGVAAGKVTLQTIEKKSLILSVDKNTDYLTSKGKKLTLKDIKADHSVLAVGIKSKDAFQVQLIYQIGTPSAKVKKP